MVLHHFQAPHLPGLCQARALLCGPWSPWLGTPKFALESFVFWEPGIIHKLALSSETLKTIVGRWKTALTSSQKCPWKDLVRYLFIDSVGWKNVALYAAVR